MKNFENINNTSEKEDKLKNIPENISNLSVEEILENFKNKHVVFDVDKCFEKTGLNLFDNFVSSYAESYEASSEDQEKVRQKLENNICSVRFDPALFLILMAQRDYKSDAMYIPELKTIFFSDLKSYKNTEISLHEVTHAIGSINNNPDGSKIDFYQEYNPLNEGITEKMTVEMTGKKNEVYSINVKCAQIIDAIIDNKVNDAFQENNVNKIEEAYDKQISSGAFNKLAYNIFGVKNIFHEINQAEITVFEFEEKYDTNRVDLVEKYDAINNIVRKEKNAAQDYQQEKTPENKEKYLNQVEETDGELEKFNDEIISYVFAKDSLLKYDQGRNLDLIYKNLIDEINKHFGILIDKSNSYEEQMEVIQKICNIQASFDFSENKISSLEEIIKENLFKLYTKMTNKKSEENVDIYNELGVKNNLKWLNK